MMMKFASVLILFLLGALSAFSEKSKEIWTSSPSLRRVGDSPLWCQSNIVKSSLGKFRHYCVFGYKEEDKTFFKIIPIVSLPVKDQVVYVWSLEGKYLLVKNTKDNKLVVKMDVSIFDEGGDVPRGESWERIE